MLQIKNICKNYKTGDLTQTALDGVSLNLRESELVAILGPSGSGKSTLLNIIGGLDRYDSGDLIIDGISTKKYSDRDWDSYRNHTIGFIFQSYNLIPHQTVLANVELALTISGVPKAERRKRAIKALEDVGLGSQLHKKPNQMSGGQMQRVAIARALVNNPGILLADEPTGALDSETSIQVMELLKDVSKDRLVVMVTHNPELAENYADRIVRVKDGKIIGDTNPFAVDETLLQEPQHKNMGKSSMSFRSAMALSFNNLKSKKGRTLLTAFAGSIGIIGIALILSLSVGFQKYIDTVQEDTLAGNPLTLQAETADILSVMMPPPPAAADSHSTHIQEQPVLSNMFQYFGANDLGAFKTHLETHMDEIGHTLHAVQYAYNIRPRVFAQNGTQYQQVNPACLFKQLTGNELISAVMDVNVFGEMVAEQELLNSQYQMLQGRWPEAADELVFVLPAPNQLSDHIAYSLGMKDLDSLDKMIHMIMDGQEAAADTAVNDWTYDDLMQMTFQLVSVPSLYRYNEEYKVWEDMSQDQEFMDQAIRQGETLHVVGIVCPKEGSNSAILSPGIAYHPSLTQKVIQEASDSQIVQEQLANMDVNVFSGKPFDESANDNSFDFHDLITIDGDAISSAFGLDVSEDEIIRLMEKYLEKMAASAEIDTTAAEQAFIGTLTDFTRQMLTQFISENADSSGIAVLRLSDTEALVGGFLDSDYAASRLAQLSEAYSVSPETLKKVYHPLIIGLTAEAIALGGETAAVPMPTENAETDEPQESSETGTDPALVLTLESAETFVQSLPENPIVTGCATIMGKKMMEPTIIRNIMAQAAGFSDVLARYFSNSFYVDADKLSGAFQLNMDEAQIRRLMDALSPEKRKQTAENNLRTLGYADPEQPASMAFYMKNFDAKEEFTEFISAYNQSAEQSHQEEKVIRYTDMSAIMMDSVRTVINTVSYCLIAFVGVSLLVSSIMIGIITYISVMERTKEIGVLRAMGASRRNITQVFNAETFIIGLCSGFLGVGITLILLIPGNEIIHILLQNSEITAYLPLISSLVLIVISMLLTLLGGLIPASQAAKKDPVIALRSE